MSIQNRLVEERDAATRLNAALAVDIARSMRCFFLGMMFLILLGIGVLFHKYTMIFAPPCWIGVLIMLALYFDARGQLREVKSRKWSSPTPWISRLNEKRMPPAKTPASHT